MGTGRPVPIVERSSRPEVYSHHSRHFTECDLVGGAVSSGSIWRSDVSIERETPFPGHVSALPRLPGQAWFASLLREFTRTHGEKGDIEG